jgi:hypothetical protein
MSARPLKALPIGIALLVTLSTASGQESSEQDDDAREERGGFWSQFRDAEDGKLDMSQWLIDNTYGFLPVPIIITEPAVENGLGLAAVFFHEPNERREGTDDGKFLLPDVTAAAAAYTGNGSWFVGGGHFNSWRQDSRRYTGLVGYADINLDFFGNDDLPPVPDGGIGFNAKGFFTDHEIPFRLGDSNWFVGGEFRYLTTDVSLDLNTGIPELDDLNSDDTISGVGTIAKFDSLDSIFSPSRGFSAEITARFNRDIFGSDYNYQELTWKLRQYFRFGERFSFAWRFDGAATSGDVPFYLEPFVQIQGIPALRYQGGTAATAEIRGGFDVTPRWSVIAFAGAGRAADTPADLTSAPSRTAYGAGFRYLLARLFGLRVGIDVARGPEDTVVYLVTGNAW